MALKIYFMTFGCKVNQYETEKLAERFARDGHIRCDELSSADVCVINSCTVTSTADTKLRHFVSRVRRENPGCIIALCGCYPSAFYEEAAKLGCDILAGNSNKPEIPQMVYDHITAISSTTDLSPSEKDCEDKSKTRAYIKIQDGCTLFCTYCIIPYARGKNRSKPLDEIEKEAAALIAAGHKEIILTGINLCCYGLGLGGNIRLIDAIERVCGIEGDFRVRLSSMEPELISNEDIARMAAQPKLCPHFHLSLQSGCDRTLAAMKRHYDTAQYSELVRKLRAAFPDCAVTTDIMAGFPGETEEDFAESLRFVRKTAFASAHIFPYSRRAGTPADEMPQQIAGSVKAERAARLAEVCKASQLEYNKSFIGKTLEVLFEREGSKPYHVGHSREYIEVRVPRQGDDSLRRQLKNVIITEACGSYCIGKIEEE